MCVRRAAVVGELEEEKDLCACVYVSVYVKEIRRGPRWGNVVLQASGSSRQYATW